MFGLKFVSNPRLSELDSFYASIRIVYARRQRGAGSPVDVKQVGYFLEAAHTLNFTRAAELCHVSQPALTMAIKRLESELGGSLFQRKGRAVELTDFGRTMRATLAEFAAHSERVRAVAHNELNLKSTPLRLGVLSSIGPVRIARFLAHVERQMPTVEVTVEEDLLDKLWTRLADGNLDVCLLNRVPETPVRFRTTKLYEERYVVVLPPNHVLCAKSQIELSDLDGLPYIDRLSCELRQAMAGVLKERRITMYAKFRSAREDWVQSMVLAGMGFAVMPEYSVTHPDLVIRVLVKPELTREIALLVSTSPEPAAHVERFVDTARAFAWPG